MREHRAISDEQAGCSRTRITFLPEFLDCKKACHGEGAACQGLILDPQDKPAVSDILKLRNKTSG
jgi:hypothetical protein